MRVLKIADVVAQEVDTVVVACKGTLVDVYPPSTFTRTVNGEEVPGSLQNGTLKDDSGQIKVVFSDREDMKKFKGKTLYILAHKSDKRGWVSTKRKDDTYKGKTTPALWVYDQATVTQDAPTDGEEQPAGKTSAPATQQQRPAAQPQQQQRQDPPADDETPEEKAARAAHEAARALAKARITINKQANLMLLCLNAADYVATQYEDKHEGSPEYFMRPEDVRTLATTLFIQAVREGLDGAMPAGVLSIKPAEKPEDKK